MDHHVWFRVAAAADMIEVSRQQECHRAELEKIIAGILSFIPSPQQSPANALLQLKRDKGQRGCYMGSINVNRDITISPRMLLELLSGERTLENFEKQYRMRREENPFRKKLKQGWLIPKVDVEYLADRGGDRITIHFGDPDPAIHPFRVRDVIKSASHYLRKVKNRSSS